jgi:OHCU decarboxylase
MRAARPFGSARALLEASEAASSRVDRHGWLEAFRHHPRIGERSAERSQSPSASQSSAREQAGMDAAAAGDREAFVQANREYEARFGHVFVVCASGKGAREMLEALRARMTNDPETELRVAAEEQKKITRLRLERLLA